MQNITITQAARPSGFGMPAHLCASFEGRIAGFAAADAAAVMSADVRDRGTDVAFATGYVPGTRAWSPPTS